MTSRSETAAYLIALGRLRGVGSRTVVNVARLFADYEALAAATASELDAALGARAGAAVREGLATEWQIARSRGQRTVDQHEARSITPIPIVDPSYPALLRLISDPPPILYVQGREASLASTKAVAVVGTREATQIGLSVGQRVAQRFAEAGYVIVSGLAKGIDTAAHEGALLGGTTVAVLGTPLDKIYPAENKGLAARIAEAGALVSEYPIGFPSRGQSFVERDRLQAGMSIAVIPVQTGIKGGTQHTIRFAEAQHRLILCPRPQPVEQDASAYDGIHELIRSGRARPFDADDYPEVWGLLEERERSLVGEASRLETLEKGAALPTGTKPKRAKKSKVGSPDDLLLFQEDQVMTGSPVVEPLVPGDSTATQVPPRSVDMNGLVSALEDILQSQAPYLDEQGLDMVFRQIRARRLADRQ